MVAGLGGLQALANRAVQLVSQGQCSGRCKVMRRAEVETRAAAFTRVRRTVAVTALPRVGLARVPAARVRLKAMQARTSQAALAVKTPEVILSRRTGVHDVHDEGFGVPNGVVDAVICCCP